MHALLSSIAAHPSWVLFAVFLVAFAESVALVGSLVPATVVMFSAGALVGIHALDLWATLGIAVLGAIAGDGLSYELGRRYRDRIKAWPVFQRYSALIDRSAQLIQQHGAKSILFARFVGPIRAIVPVLAGMGEMRRGTFYFANIGSALAWAPAHILPGVIFGASIAIAKAVSGRLAAILLLIAGLVWAIDWLARLAIKNGVPIIRQVQNRVLQWARQRPLHLHSGPKYWALVLLDPKRRDSQALLAWAIIFVVCASLFLVLTKEVITRDAWVQLDLAVFNLLQTLRTTPASHLMIGITELGSLPVRLALILAVSAWLISQRCWRTARYWVLLTGISEGVVRLLVLVTGRARPIDLYSGLNHFSFPSGHATSSMVIYGFLAYLIASRQSSKTWTPIAAITALGIVLIGISRLYLGANWLSDVLASWTFGAAGLAFSIFVYTRRRVRENVRPKWLGVFSTVVILISGTWVIRSHYAADLALYSPHPQAQTLSLERWVGTEWEKLPVRRVELRGESDEALLLQWAEKPETLTRKLQKSGWVVAPEWSVKTGLLWLIPGAPVAELPVLPKYDQGKSSKLAFVLLDPKQSQSRTVLRLWESNYRLEDPAFGANSQVPVWYGAFYSEEFKEPWHLFTLGIARNISEISAFMRLLPSGVKAVRHVYSNANAAARQAVLVLPNTASKRQEQ